MSINDAYISFKDERLRKTVQQHVKLFAKLILLQRVLKRLVELLAVELVYLQKEWLHFLVV